MSTLDFLGTLGRAGRAIPFIILALLFTTPRSLRADTNSWIKSTNGQWHEATSWSLGMLPNSSQSVTITNSGEKTVTINSATAQNYPTSLILNNLTIARTNTLFLDNINTNVSLQILGRLELGLYGNFVQIGGSSRAGGVLLSSGKCNLTNAIFETADVLFIGGASFNQNGGTGKASRLDLLAGSYNVSGVNLTVTNSIIVAGLYGPALFSQDGGTNRTSSLSVSKGSAVGGSPANYSMNGGLLCTSNTTVGLGSTFSQNGGVHIVTNALRIIGDGRYFPIVPDFAIYVSGGVLLAKSVQMNELSMFSVSGTTTVLESFQFIGTSQYVGTVSLSGMLACSNVLNEGGVVDIEQSGGTFIVTNLFSFAGYYIGGYYGYGARFARYNFSAGTLTASNIELFAEIVVGSSTQIGRITNSGYFKMGGALIVGDATEQLGRFILASNATINLGGGSAKLNFANSSAENWNVATKLIVTNWNGSPTGGGDDQLKFGSNASGLTAAQLNQIRFVNPAGFPSGEFLAQIMDTGEVAPRPGPTLFLAQNGTNLVLSWTGNFLLQTSTNVNGPYQDLPGVASPHTNGVTESSQRYFRLRQ